MHNEREKKKSQSGSRTNEPKLTTVDPAAFFDKVVGEYAQGIFETRKWGSQWLLIDKSYSEDYSLAVIENDVLYLTYSLQGEDARPFHPLYKDMDKGTPRRFKKLCACISIHSPRAGAKLRAYIDMYDYKKA